MACHGAGSGSPLLCDATPDPQHHRAVLGVLSAAESRFRQPARNSWLASANGEILVRFVVRAGNASGATIREASHHGDMVFVDAQAGLDRASGPLHSLWLWWEYALRAWPNAELIGKADEDVWLHLGGIAALLAQASHACEHELRLRSPRLYWGVMETFSWATLQREPVGWDYAFRAKGVSPACQGRTNWERATTTDAPPPPPTTTDEAANRSSVDVALVGPFK